MTAPELVVALGAGLVAGLASALHCAAMCGPVAGVVGHRAPSGALRYQGGRTIGYAGLGALVGTAGDVIVRTMSGAVAGALVSWVFAAALGFAAFRLWRADRHALAPNETATVVLGRARPKPTLTERLVASLPREPLFFGVATALLPCGALYGALLLAAGTARPATGAALMIGFSLTTGVGLISVAWLGARLRGRLSPVFVRLIAVALAAAAVFIAIRPAASLAQPEAPTHECCGTSD